MFGQMTMPDGQFENVVIVGSEAASLLGNAWVMADGDPVRSATRTASSSTSTTPTGSGHGKVGDAREINGHRARSSA